MEEVPAPDAEHHWFRIGRILDFDERQKFETLLDEAEESLPDDVPVGQAKTFGRKPKRLYQAVHLDEVIAYYTETDQDYDRVLDIFVRANDGGTKLSKSDILSMVTSNWDGVNAREEIFNFVDRINTQLTRRNDFDKDFIMKSYLIATSCPPNIKFKTSTTKIFHRFGSNGQRLRKQWNEAWTLPTRLASTLRFPHLR